MQGAYILSLFFIFSLAGEDLVPAAARPTAQGTERLLTNYLATAAGPPRALSVGGAQSGGRAGPFRPLAAAIFGEGAGGRTTYSMGLPAALNEAGYPSPFHFGLWFYLFRSRYSFIFAPAPCDAGGFAFGLSVRRWTQ